MIEITEQNLESVLAEGKLVVIDFGAAWCGPCRRVAPVLEALSKDYEGQAVIGRVDIEASEDIALRYGVRNIPTVVFVKGGEVVDTLVGLNPRAKYEDKIKALL